MSTIYFDTHLGDEERRRRLYSGDVFVYSPRPSDPALTELARELIEAAFAPLDPQHAQDSLPVEKFVEIARSPQAPVHPPPADQGAAGRAAPRPRVRHRQDLLRRPPHAGRHQRRLSHRRRRLPAPSAPRHLVPPPMASSTGGCRSSRSSRRAPSRSTPDTGRAGGELLERVQPLRVEPGGPEARREGGQGGYPQAAQAEDRWSSSPRSASSCPPAVLIFSGAQLHSSVPNSSGRTRFSIDFRTAHLDELKTLGEQRRTSTATAPARPSSSCGAPRDLSPLPGGRHPPLRSQPARGSRRARLRAPGGGRPRRGDVDPYGGGVSRHDRDALGDGRPATGRRSPPSKSWSRRPLGERLPPRHHHPRLDRRAGDRPHLRRRPPTRKTRRRCSTSWTAMAPKRPSSWWGRAPAIRS